VSVDAGIEPMAVTTFALTARRSMPSYIFLPKKFLSPFLYFLEFFVQNPQASENNIKNSLHVELLKLLHPIVEGERSEKLVEAVVTLTADATTYISSLCDNHICISFFIDIFWWDLQYFLVIP